MSVLDRFRLDGKRLFITGGSRGLGREMALAIADVGADCILVGRDEESLNRTADDNPPPTRAPENSMTDDNPPPTPASDNSTTDGNPTPTSPPPPTPYSSSDSLSDSKVEKEEVLVQVEMVEVWGAKSPSIVDCDCNNFSSLVCALNVVAQASLQDDIERSGTSVATDDIIVCKIGGEGRGGQA